MLEQPLSHPDRLEAPTGTTGIFREMTAHLAATIPPDGAILVARTLRAELPRDLGRIAHATLGMLIDRLGADERSLLSTDGSNDGDDAIDLDAEAKDHIRRLLRDSVLKDLQGYDVVGEGIGAEDRIRRPIGWIWVVIDPLDGSKYFETTGEGAAVAIGAFIQVTPNRVERLAVAIASTAGRTTVTVSHGGTVRVTKDGVNFYEVPAVPVGRRDAVAMVTGRKPDRLVYLAALAERLGLRADAQAGNPALPKLLLWGSSLVVQPGPHKVYDALWLYAAARRDDLHALDMSGRPIRLEDLDTAVSAWVNAGCRNDDRTVPPYVVSTDVRLAHKARKAALAIGPCT